MHEKDIFSKRQWDSHKPCSHTLLVVFSFMKEQRILRWDNLATGLTTVAKVVVD